MPLSLLKWRLRHWGRSEVPEIGFPSHHFDPPSTMARLQKLTEFFQAGTLNFVEFLLKKVIDDCRDEDRQWFHFSLESALKDMEDEPLVYSEADLKEHFQ